MESNHPATGLPPPAGFEGRMGHQTPAAPRPSMAGEPCRRAVRPRRARGMLSQATNEESAVTATVPTPESRVPVPRDRDDDFSEQAIQARLAFLRERTCCSSSTNSSAPLGQKVTHSGAPWQVSHLKMLLEAAS